MTQPDPLLPQLRRATDLFARRFGRPARFAAVAPGRVNLIGEHTDYNDGFVLPMAIERQTVVLADRVERENRTTLTSSAAAGEASFVLDGALTPGEPAWANYVKGVLAGCLTRGLDPGPVDVLIDSTVPLGGGLSSSASLEVATATLVEAVVGRTLEPRDKALLCQKAEHEFAGTPCGIMDQFIAVLAREGHALLLDCRNQSYQLVPLSDPKVAVLVIDSRVKHELAGGEYARRRKECEEAVRRLGVKSLRDVTLEELKARERGFEKTLFRRALHVIAENERTPLAARTAKAGDWAALGRLMHQSHLSLRDDYEVSCPELDLLVDEAIKIGQGGGLYGARMTGGGFGGCTVNLVKADRAERIAQEVCTAYKASTGIEPAWFVTRPAGGARVIQLGRD